MRVLFITGEFPPMQGGVGDCTNEIARALSALGADVGVLTSIHAAGDIAIRHSPLTVFPSIKKWGWLSFRAISDTIHEFSPDIVHVQFQTAAFGMHPAIYFLPSWLYLSPSHIRGGGRGVGSGVKVVTTFHDLRVPYLFPKAGFVRDWITRYLARSCDAAIATSKEDYSELETWRLRRLSLIPIGSNITTTPPPNYQRSAWRAKLGVAENEMLLCYFGFLNESKGGKALIRALALVPNSKLLMIGGQTGASDPTNAAYLARVKKMIGELGLSDRVLWTDYTPPELVTANFLASDICVLPYRDGASFRRGTLMAALAHGMPIVTTRGAFLTPPSIQGATHAVSTRSNASSVERASHLPTLRDGENCLLVPPDDPHALADAIQRAAASPELRAKISAGARDLAQHFTWDKIAQQHLELYQRLQVAR